MRALFLLVALCACGDNIKPNTDDAGPGSDGSVDASPQVTGHCIDRPGALPPELHPPTGALPCEMLPPGFTVSP